MRFKNIEIEIGYIANAQGFSLSVPCLQLLFYIVSRVLAPLSKAAQSQAEKTLNFRIVSQIFVKA